MRRRLLIIALTCTAIGLVLASGVGVSPVGPSRLAIADETVEGTIVYFLRHGEDQVALYEPGGSRKSLLRDCKPYVDDGEIDECCLETLNSLGEKRAELLAAWFEAEGIVADVTHMIASHKIRTRQTLQPTADLVGMTGDVDQNPDDGIQQVPAFVDECASGFESSKSSRDPMLEAINGLPGGSAAIVCAHSPTLYPMMDSLGIDTSNPDDFPRRPNGKVKGNNNLWIVAIDGDGNGVLLDHKVVDFVLAEQ